MDRDFILQNQTEVNPYGKLFLTISIGDFSFKFKGLKEDQKNYLKKNYKGFIGKNSDNSFVVNVGMLDNEIKIQNPDFDILDCDDFSVLAGSYFYALKREGENSAILKILKGNQKFFLFAVENFLRWMISKQALFKNGLLLHASAKVIETEAHIFLGNHGAGKSTAVQLIEKVFTIADDVVLIISEKDCYCAYTMPAITKFEQKVEEIGKFKIKAFYKLVKSDENKLKKLTKPIAFAALVSSIPFLINTNRHHYLAKNIIEKIPFYNLFFKKEKNFFDEAVKSL